MWLWIQNLQAQGWRWVSRRRQPWTSSPQCNFPSTHSWYACRWRRLPSPSGKNCFRLIYIKVAYFKMLCCCWSLVVISVCSTSFCSKHCKLFYSQKCFCFLLSAFHLSCCLYGAGSSWPNSRGCLRANSLSLGEAGTSWWRAPSSLSTKPTRTCASSFTEKATGRGAGTGGLCLGAEAVPGDLVNSRNVWRLILGSFK